MRRPDRIVVVGASLAGQRAARALRSAGFTGELTLVGEERHVPYNRPPLSKAVLRGDMGFSELMLDREAQRLDVAWRLGTRATRLDVANGIVGLADGSTVNFDAALIATGVSARRLEVPGANLENIHYLRTFDDAEKLREALASATNLLVVGAGFIGCEVAASAVQMGIAVTVVDPAAVPMERVLGAELGLAAQRRHEEHGVRFLMGRSIVGFEGRHAVAAALLDSGERVRADVVVIGIGSVPNTSWLEGSGLECSNGVVCEETCLVPATQGRIAAAGDVANWPHPAYGGRRMRVEHWSQAAEQGEAAALALLDPCAARPYAPVLSMWSDQYGRKLQAVGAPWLGDRIQVSEGTIESHQYVAEAYLGVRLVGAVIFAMPSRAAKYRRRLEEAAAVASGVQRQAVDA